MKAAFRHPHHYIPLLAAAAIAAVGSQLPGLTQAQTTTGRPDVALHCSSFGKGPMLECAVKVTGKDGAPLNGASMTLGALMPSMPMAHTVKRVNAAPTGQPGEYKGTLKLEMAGFWAVDVDISGPARDKATRHVQVMPCNAGDKCAAQSVKPGEQAVGHGSHGAKPAPGAHKH